MPDNTIGWGQGAANNTNGWGAAAQNNNLDWGYIHSRSYGHDETNLTGQKNFFDLFGTPAAAYSLRDLSGINPNVIEARRDSDNLTRDFTAPEITNGTLAAWVGAGNNGFVRTLYDQAIGENLLQTTSSNQPKIVNAGSVILLNGKPAIQFDGVDDNLQNNTFSTGSPSTSFLVASTNQPASLNRFTEGGTSSNRVSFFTNAGNYQFFAGSTLTASASDTSQRIFYGLADGVNGEFSVNGTLFSGDTGSDVYGGLTIGARWDRVAQFLNGNIQELIIYDANKSSERTDIVDNLNEYY